jgi:poly(3-hydroxybutyrate) depolymerase
LQNGDEQMTALPDAEPTVQADSAATQAQPRLPWSGPYLFVSSSGRRPYYVYTPTRYQLGTSVPLVVMLHGCSQTPRGVEVATGWNDLAEERNFVVYPGRLSRSPTTRSPGRLGIQAANKPTPRPGSPRGSTLTSAGGTATGTTAGTESCRRIRAATPASRRPIAGITQAVMANTTQWTIDPARVYVAGMSAGGAMAVILGATYPELYSAVAAHSALEYKAAINLLGAFQALTQGGPDPLAQGQEAFQAMGSHARVMPVLVVHGTNDLRVNPVNGGPGSPAMVGNQPARHRRHVHRGGRHSGNRHPLYRSCTWGHPYRVRTWIDNHGKTVHEYWGHRRNGPRLVRRLLAGVVRRHARTQRHPGHVLLLLTALTNSTRTGLVFAPLI